MSGRAEKAARTYVAAAEEADAERRAALLEQCWADDGRLVTRSRVLRGRAEVSAMIGELHADPRGLQARLAGPIDAQGSTFRFRSIVVDRAGATVGEFFDAAEVDADGRITVLLTFAGPY